MLLKEALPLFRAENERIEKPVFLIDIVMFDFWNRK